MVHVYLGMLVDFNDIVSCLLSGFLKSEVLSVTSFWWVVCLAVTSNPMTFGMAKVLAQRASLTLTARLQGLVCCLRSGQTFDKF